VLIAVDGSDDGFEAVRQAARLIKPGKDQVVLYYSVPQLRLETDSSTAPAIAGNVEQALARAVVEEARKLLSPGFTDAVQEIVNNEDPRDGIIRAAEHAKADMMVVGARGLSPLARMLLGSVSKSVVRGARVPVLVARQRKGARQDGGMRVLVACDRPDTASAMSQLVCSLTWPPGTAGYSITVLPGLLGGETPAWLKQKARSPEIEQLTRAWVDEQQAELRQTKDRLAEFCRCLPDAFRENAITVEGHPADRILETIDRQNIDLVVVGARRLGAIERFMVGSTSEAVMNYAPCSVLIIRDKDSAKQV